VVERRETERNADHRFSRHQGNEYLGYTYMTAANADWHSKYSFPWWREGRWFS